ncbi:NERD domain-containing protein [Texcoconibacillus texcoconensis]|uniref:NERD domain-containing protein n=1 Tax=Texcoconibacillus texcoconensis TaxID=1095777 RepID=A0A840QTA2_9BACI|nr:NERD domain-containing protein [Texcoconibacillus texcoconensis]MBB5174595.1 hypothetical protein [Texcoconibacillus texcoconensis]
MIVLQRQIPHPNRVLETLTRRLPENHPDYKRIHDDYQRRTSGYRGEQSMDYYLRFLQPQDCSILHGLTLRYNGNKFQIDTLILFPKFALIIEIKNWTGKLQVTETGDFLRTDLPSEKLLQDPIQQAKHQQWQLQAWLKQRGHALTAVDHLVVLTHQNAIISNASVLHPKIIRHTHFIDTIHQLIAAHANNQPQPNTIATHLKNEHLTPTYNTNNLHTYDIQPPDIITGVHCPACSTTAMRKPNKHWICPHCRQHSRTAHIQAIQDYTLIHGRITTSRQIKDFLRIKHTQHARRIMRSLGAHKQGTTKGATYDLLTSPILQQYLLH